MPVLPFQPTLPAQAQTHGHVRLTLSLTLALFTFALLLQLPAVWWFAEPGTARFNNWLGHFSALSLLIFCQRRLPLISLKIGLFGLYYSYLTYTGWLWPELGNTHYFYLLAVVISGFVFTRQEQLSQWLMLTTALCLFEFFSCLQYQSEVPVSALSLSNDFTLALLCVGIYALLRRQALGRWHTLRTAHRSSEATLNAMLPRNPDQPQQLWAMGTTRELSHICVLFADLHGYTALNRQLGDRQVVQILSQLFARIDNLAEHYCIEKIKTNGDQYMAISGLSPASRNNCCNEMLNFAKAIVNTVARCDTQTPLDCAVRVGIATGPVTAGIMGKDKPFFDVWGETVNLAAYLEQASPTGSISLCEHTVHNLSDKTALRRVSIYSQKHPDLTHCFEIRP